mgnify:CR=1 FL=1|tara:strand:+ start:30688 stop:31449 length:762 start_codon:yes stop_codon:yes gene_type:complete
MIRVSILGAGNVAAHLFHAFLEAPTVELVQVYSRNDHSLKPFAAKVDTTTDLNMLKKADVYIIAISDDAIAKFSLQLKNSESLVVHTSGGVDMDVLSATVRKGVFYPLQTFTKNKKVDFKTIPICIEAQHNSDLVLLEKLAAAISNEVFIVNSKQRASLHIAAVFVNNFTNHMYHIGHTICAENTVPFEILAPLIQETAKKILDLAPYKAQTGPAKRNDTQTIAKHIAQLSDTNKELYELITKSITSTYEQKL